MVALALPVWPISHDRNGRMKVGTLNAYGFHDSPAPEKSSPGLRKSVAPKKKIQTNRAKRKARGERKIRNPSFEKR